VQKQEDSYWKEDEMLDVMYSEAVSDKRKGTIGSPTEEEDYYLKKC